MRGIIAFDRITPGELNVLSGSPALRTALVVKTDLPRGLMFRILLNG